MNAVLELFTLGALLSLSIGAVLGLVVGAIPGLTAMMAMALLLPVTFGLDSTSAIALLVGCYIGGIAGGLVSSTLLGMPGNSSSIATTFDAYPMARQGNPVRALGIGSTASLLGGMLGFLALITISPVVADVAMALGNPEYFALTMLALTLVAILAGDDMRKGLAAACLGLLAGAVGFAPIDSSERFTFGFTHLWGGIDILPLIIGLFAIAEMLRVLLSDGRRDTAADLTFQGFGLGVKLREVYRSSWNVVRSSLIGIAIGVLPGMGGTAANLLAYARAKQVSNEPKRFGKGAPDGIWAPEASNSAATGGSLVPMLTLGIPGDGVTAVMLGGLVIHGIQPGPLLFSENPEVVTTVFVYFAVAVVAVFAFQVLGTRIFPRVLSVPRRYLLPILVVFMSVGTYAGHYQIADAWLMLLFGVLGFALVTRGFPLSPLLLGYILGPIAEVCFRRALMDSSGDFTIFLARPWSAAFLLVAMLVLALTLWKRHRPSHRATGTDARATERESSGSLPDGP